MKTRLSLLILLSFFGFTQHIQSQNIKGQVQTGQQKPVAFATVALLNARDSSLAKAGISNENGTFEFAQIKPGTYLVQAQSVGLSKISSASFMMEINDVLLPALTLPEAAQTLNEVKITARKPLIEVLPDRMVFNVEGSINAAGNTALELLQKSPGVIVDQNDNIVLQGRNGVMVYIDGKPSPLSMKDLATYLRSLPSEQIEAIEIITQPSAKYDAAGNAGIINIRLKKSADRKNFGTNGTVSLGAAQGMFFPKWTGALTLNHRTSRANWFGTYSNRTAKDWSYINMYREQAGTRYDQKSSTDSRSNAHNFKTGADFFLNKKNTLGFLLNGNLNDRTSVTNGRTPIGPIGQPIASVLIAKNQSQNDRFTLNTNLNYRYADTLGHELNMDADYGRFQSDGTQFQPNRYTDVTEMRMLSERNYRMNTLTDITIFTLKSDYEQRLWGGKIAGGVKVSFVETDNAFDFFDVIDTRDVLNTNRTNTFTYRENVNAAYVSYQRKLNKIQWQGGLRLEQTRSEGHLKSSTTQADANVKRQYLDLFPSAGLTYDYNSKNTFALNYSRRIDRPTYQDLNPFESKLDELSYAKGNAFLRPQYTNNVQLSHTYNYSLTTSLSYSRTTDVVAQLTDTVEVNRNFISPKNLASNDVISLNVSYPFNVAKWWNVYFNAGLYHTRYRADLGTGRQIHLNATAYNFYAQNTFSLPKKFSLEVSGFYSSPSIWGGTYVSRPIGNLDLGLQKKLFSDRGNLKLTVSDIFFTQQWGGVSQFGGLKMIAGGGWESRQVRLNFSYNFGSSQIKTARQRRTGLEDEKGRIGE